VFNLIIYPNRALLCEQSFTNHTSS